MTPSHADTEISGYRTKPLLEFVTGLIGREDAVLCAIRMETAAKDLPPINVGPDEGRILHFLATSCRAKMIVEVGTLAGYSACWMARALGEGGMLHTIEYDPRHAAVAKENIARANLTAKITVHLGAGMDILPKLSALAPFDMCFIDADKAGCADYTRWAVDNVRSGGWVSLDIAYLFGMISFGAAGTKGRSSNKQATSGR